ncbi:hypothetical protein GOBAR_AA22118 [Gossypium barbadense]|uniref:Bet v I/Major latex protein domain-containing protein n=1 Tax=Gossypium barbadense TaxID=3634 RepID=A0A2P5X5C6_GOSBA|nr:hypothetical protein GOBAR_AA22118 [Gossypium barbadense]
MGVVTYEFEVTSPVAPTRLFKAFVLEGLPFQYMKHMIGGHDENNLSYSYSLIEGGPLGDKLEKISYENQFVAAASGRSVCKSSIKFYTVGDYVITEDEIKALIQRSEVVYKAIEAFLLANPDACN